MECLRFIISRHSLLWLQVCIAVEAVNEVQLVSERASSDCAVADASPPVCTFIGGGISPGTHVMRQSYRDVLFGNLIATEDIAAIDSIEWCASSSTGGGGGADAACDIVPLTTVGIGHLPFRPQRFVIFGAGDLAMSPNDEVTISATVRNAVGLVSSRCTSEAVRIGSLELNITQSQIVKFVADLSIPDYAALAANESATELGEGDTFTMFNFAGEPGDRATFELRDDSLARRNRRMDWLLHGRGAASDHPVYGGGTMATAGFYPSSYAFTFSMTDASGGANPAATLWSTKHKDPMQLLESDDIAHLSSAAIGLLVPDLWLVNASSGHWVKARETCAASASAHPVYWHVRRATNEYEVNVCDWAPGNVSAGSSRQFV
jgi:hypothetical protein